MKSKSDKIKETWLSLYSKHKHEIYSILETPWQILENIQ